MEFTTISSVLFANLEKNPDKEALVFRDRRFTYRQVGEQVDKLAEALIRLGIRKGDKVALDLPNWPEFIFAFFAIARLGATVVMINIRYRAAEVKHILKDSEATAVIVPAEFDDFKFPAMVEEMRAELPELRHIIAVGNGEGPRGDAEGGAGLFVGANGIRPGAGAAGSGGDTDGSAVLSFDALLAQSNGQPVAEAEIDPREDITLIMYTSGTTGAPKGAMTTHYGLLQTDEANALPFGFTPDDVFLIAIPASHITGLFCLDSCFEIGGKAVLVDAFKAEPVLQIIERERVTVQFAVPTVYTLELAHADKYDISSMRTGLMAGASCPAELVRRLLDRGYQALVGYGMTETTGGLCSTTTDDDFVARTETVGRPVTGVEMKFVDDERCVVPDGQVGEIAVRSAGRLKGYYKNPEATAAAIDADGWFYTGDLGIRDERAYVRIAGRKKDMIIRGGFNIYPAEVEALLFTNPKVLEAAVIGVPDTVLGEKTCACVRLREGQEMADVEIKDYCRGKLADFKVPDYVRFVDSFPLTASGKIYKIGLREEVLRTLKTI